MTSTHGAAIRSVPTAADPTAAEASAQFFRDQVAEEVRALMARRRIRGRAAAKTLGVSHTYVHRRLNGETPFDTMDLARFAELLDVPLEQLLRGPVAAFDAAPAATLSAQPVTAGDGEAYGINRK
jgi:hypothetical protein